MANLDDLVGQLERQRLEADRAYNDALTHFAKVLRTEVPAMPPAPIEPHTDAHAATTRELIELTRRRFEESVRFQHALAMFLMQITGIVETRDRALGGTSLRTEIVQMRARVQELGRDIERAAAPPKPAPAPAATKQVVDRGQAKIDALERLRDGSQDSFVSRGVVEHLDAAQLLRYLTLLHQKLRPGAELVIHAINGASWSAYFGEYIRDTARVNVLRPETLLHFVERAGFGNAAIKLADKPAELPRAAAQHDPAAQAIADIINAHADRLNSRLFAALTFTVTAVR